MADVARLDQFLHRSRDIFHRNLGIDAVLIEEVDTVGPQPCQCLVGDLSDALSG